MSLTSQTLVRCSLLLALVVAGPAVAASCAKAESPSSSTFGDDGTGSGGGGGSGAGVGGSGAGTGSPGGGSGPIITVPDAPMAATGSCANPMSKCTDFPAMPIMDPNGMPASDPSAMFGAPGTGSTGAGAPCLVEPAGTPMIPSLYPKNWLRPRVYWGAGSGQTVFEVRLSTPGEANDLVVYTTKTYWAMSAALWQQIAYSATGDAGSPVDGSLVGAPITVTVRALAGSTVSVSNSATFQIAPAIADGALVYWTTQSFVSNSTTNLQGFRVGDEGTTPALAAAQVQQTVRAQAAPLTPGGAAPNLQPAQFNQVFCIGCHTATPDGNYVSFTSQWPWAVALASVQAGSPGMAPPWLTTGAASNLSPNINGFYAPPAVNQVMMGIQTFSPAHYVTGDRKLVAALGAAWNQTEAQITALPVASPGSATGVVSQLAWFDLEYTGAPPAGAAYNPWQPGPSAMDVSPLPVAVPCEATVAEQGTACATGTNGGGWGLITRTGDTNSAGGPNWSHNLDGKTDYIAYGSTNLGTKDGRMDCELTGSSCVSDVYVVPYNGGMGGAAAGLPGASDAMYNEYYPAWSPDDQLIAFNRVGTGQSMYNTPQAEVYVVPYNGGMGGTATRLAANDPVACTGLMSPGVQNTWPKWAPNPLDANMKPVAQTDKAGNTYYWVTFSSTRAPQAASTLNEHGMMQKDQQLYVSGVVVDAKGNITTYAPIYLWNQDYTVNNLIPAWGEFTIPSGKTPPPATTAIPQ
jgi:hypothetical protein